MLLRDQGTDPPAAAAAASAPGAAAALNHYVHEENQSAQEQQTEQAARILPVSGAVRLRGRRRRAAEGDAAILRDYIRDAAGEQRYTCIVVSLTEIRDHLAAEAADFAVGEDGFQTVADLRPIFVIIYGEENQDAAGGLLGTDAPFGCDVEGIIFYRAIAQRWNDHDENLRFGFVVYFGTERVELLASG